MSAVARLASCLALLTIASIARADPPTIDVAADASVQQAIDAAPDGATIRLAAGTFRERLAITKPLTLVGAGWDLTIIQPDAGNRAKTDAERIAFARQIEAANGDEARVTIAREYVGAAAGPTVTVRGAAGVSLRSLSVRGSPETRERGAAALVQFDGAADATVDACAILGPANNGVAVTNGSGVTVTHTLVAAVWNIGVLLDASRGARPSTLRLADSDVRNCYYVGVACSGAATVERCRISGSAWHGIRYGGTAPTIRGNAIFGNARIGIYADGGSSAAVSDNLFWRNEMAGIACWPGNADTIERNTVVGNRGVGVAVNGAARPTVARNLFVGNVVAVQCGKVAGRNGEPEPGEPSPTIEANLFWRHDADLKRMNEPTTLPAGNEQLDPKFVAADKDDFTLVADSPARTRGVGAADPLPVASPWPLTDAERAIIPDTDTRDWQKWKKPAGMR